MATKTKSWTSGTGSVTIQYEGQGDGSIIITSDANSLYEARSMQITVETTDGSGIQRAATINQAAKLRIDISAAVVTASNQTYNGSAKTPTPTVTLNGTTIPSSGYDVAYSNNTNAGTATITVTGKGDYTGTAYGTFTIAKASRTLSFADTYMVLNTSSTGTKTATPSAGSGDGVITYSISSTTYATINSSSGKVTSKTSDGSATVTATIAEGTNYLSATATYTLYVFATTHNYDYNGSYRSVTLPPGTYQFQVWGAQGGSNGTNSSYGITAKSGGKGGYSVGQLTIPQATDVRVYVGGQGSSSAGGYNGGGSTAGTSQYSSGNTFGYSKMGGGGGASDIRLSDGALLSRMIVAGGGSGGAYTYKSEETTTSTTETVSSFTDGQKLELDGSTSSNNYRATSALIPVKPGDKLEFTTSGGSQYPYIQWLYYNKNGVVKSSSYYGGDLLPGTQYMDSETYYVRFMRYTSSIYSTYPDYAKVVPKITHYTTVTTTDSGYQVGYAGGGTTGAGYSSTYQGKQNAAGSGGSFGQGANQTTTGYRYCSGAGGGGWYGGGGGQHSDSSMTYCKYSGGGSGFVNTAANAQYRPSGYTGLQLDSGETKAGNTSFPNTAGTGNETGHSGNGYAKITRIS